MKPSGLAFSETVCVSSTESKAGVGDGGSLTMLSKEDGWFIEKNENRDVLRRATLQKKTDCQRAPGISTRYSGSLL